MKTIKEVCSETGLTPRTLRHYDDIGLLSPKRDASNYRQYDDNDIEKLHQILLYRELGIALDDIKKILNDPDYDRKKVLDKQIEELLEKKRHIDNLIEAARILKLIGLDERGLDPYGVRSLDEFAEVFNRVKKNPDYQDTISRAEQVSGQEKNVIERHLHCFEACRNAGHAADSKEAEACVEEATRELERILGERGPVALTGFAIALQRNGEAGEYVDRMSGKEMAGYISDAIWNKIFSDIYRKMYELYHESQEAQPKLTELHQAQRWLDRQPAQPDLYQEQRWPDSQPAERLLWVFRKYFANISEEECLTICDNLLAQNGEEDAETFFRRMVGSYFENHEMGNKELKGEENV